MPEIARFKILLTDGRNFTLEADSYKLEPNSRHGPAHIFRANGNDVCVVLSGKLTAVVEERALKGEISPEKSPDLDEGVAGSTSRRRSAGNGKRESHG